MWRDRFALSFPCIFACACAVALLVHLFEASFKLGDTFLGERQLIGGQGAGHVGGLGEGEHGGAGPARCGACTQDGAAALTNGGAYARPRLARASAGHCPRASRQTLPLRLHRRSFAGVSDSAMLNTPLGLLACTMASPDVGSKKRSVSAIC